MKNVNKILNLVTSFMAVIGVCAAALVCFIVIYTSINGSFSLKENKTSSQNAIAQANSDKSEYSPPEYNNLLPESDTLSEQQVPDTQASETAPSDKNISSEYKSALSSANNYSSLMHMSKASIYEQLVSEYGENFSAESAQYAVDNMTADWNANALQKAKEYSDTMHMSKSSIYDQLISEYGEKFTQSEAQYAVDNLVADYNFNALQKAKEYQSLMNMSPSAIRDQLTSEYGEKFTQGEADYAIANLE